MKHNSIFTEDSIEDHLETYCVVLHDISEDEKYEPSLLFGWQEKIQPWVRKHLGEESIDPEDDLKALMLTVFSFVGLFSLVVLGIVVF